MLRSFISPRLWLAFALPLLVACEGAPDCRFQGEGDEAVTAGCLVLHQEKLLLIEARGNKWSPPAKFYLPTQTKNMILVFIV